VTHALRIVKRLRELHVPESFTHLEFPEPDPGVDAVDNPVERLVIVCRECRRVETSDASHWAETGLPAGSLWPCKTAEVLGAKDQHPPGWSPRH
jgi:hypothetical protein